MTREDNRILKPRIHRSVFVAEGARIYGDVVVGEGSSIWFNAVLRGDEGRISIGREVNVQDNSVIHSDLMVEAEIGDRTTIGHGAVLRGCRIGRNVMIGMNCTIMTRVEIGDDCVVGAGSLIPYHKKFPPRSLILGSPAVLVRELTDEEAEMNGIAVGVYRDLIKSYSTGMIKGHTD